MTEAMASGAWDGTVTVIPSESVFVFRAWRARKREETGTATYYRL